MAVAVDDVPDPLEADRGADRAQPHLVPQHPRAPQLRDEPRRPLEDRGRRLGEGVRLHSPSWSVPPTTMSLLRGTTYVGPALSSHQRSSPTCST